MRIAKSTKLTKARIKTSLNVTENTIFIKKCQGAKGMCVGFFFFLTPPFWEKEDLDLYASKH